MWESGPRLELDLDASIQKSSMVALLSSLTNSRSPETGTGNTFHFYMVTTGHNSQRNELRAARGGEILL